MTERKDLNQKPQIRVIRVPFGLMNIISSNELIPALQSILGAEASVESIY